mgnify:CR=1 FL=1
MLIIPLIFFLKVDIGAHWELSGTQPNTLYDVSSTVAQGRQAEGGTGNDPIANKDDEYAFSPYCRFDDDDANADNEWAGAWCVFQRFHIC